MNEPDLQAELEAACHKHKVPGASAALYVDGKSIAGASGVTNVVTGVEMTPDAIMHIGSITKVMTATLVMQLVDAGSLSLDHSVVEYLPDLRLGDAESLRRITVEQLVNHTSGIDANLLPTAGHDEETIEKTVLRFANAGQVHAPGEARSYCNAGMVIAGYLCQRITGMSWYDLIKQQIFKPLGMEHAAVLPEDALLYRPSIGHFVDRTSGVATRTSEAFLGLGYAPAGSTAMMSATDLLTFLCTHMADGVGSNGARILSPQSAALMRRRSGPVSGPSCFDGGIGWMLLPSGLVHHGGGGPGILSWCVAHPATQTVIVVLTNADIGFRVANELIGPFVQSRFGFLPFPLPKPTALDPEIDLAQYAGEYENNTVIHKIEARDRRLYWSARAKAHYSDASPLEEQPPIPLVPVENGSFLSAATEDEYANSISIGFFGLTDGRMQYLVNSYRMHRRRDV